MPSPSDRLWEEHAPKVSRVLLDESAQLNVLVAPQPPHLILAARGPATTVVGRERSALEGLPLAELVPQEAAPGLLPFSVSFLAEPGGYAEVALRRGDGSNGVVALNVAPLDGEDAPVLVQISEVGQFVQLSSQLRALHQQLSAAHRQLLDQGKKLDEARRAASLSLFAAGLAHELNNPLAILLSNSQAMPDYLGDVAQAANGNAGEALTELNEMAGEMQSVCRRISTTVKALGELEHRPVRGEVDLLSVVKSLAAEFAPAEVSGEPVLLVSDATLLRRLLRPVLDNARKASAEQATVTVRVSADDQQARVEVDDTGAGIPDELSEQVYDPFFTTRPPGSGLGLGLFMARRAASLLSGELTHQPKPDGKGCRFVATVPRTLPEQPDLRLNYEKVRTRR